MRFVSLVLFVLSASLFTHAQTLPLTRAKEIAAVTATEPAKETLEPAQTDPIQLTVTCNLSGADCLRFLRITARSFGYRVGEDGPDTAAGRRAFVEKKLVDYLVNAGAGLESSDDADSARETRRQEFELKFRRTAP